MMGEGMEACIEEGMDGEGMDGGGHGWGRAWICKYAVILYKKSSPITRSTQLQASWPSSWGMPCLGMLEAALAVALYFFFFFSSDCFLSFSSQQSL
jgi:hypothetical protein